ncbi:flavonol synthase/flavanone 3-hydroxylase-like [Pyrus ussuriensis x Pyrus communis]|uniref:Flavonol synthase/flavanone 3-hydroxylase-like n=1 Tax=Pyrus ussuriensis x Pyrus communis TaxID=2448454 RepID=A0A5N5FJ83_9ROSA|nr:flavonol synthase/flavanone 3-hydroxylase-like [Pyrus ussuriensis x Pyrus communis]
MGEVDPAFIQAIDRRPNPKPKNSSLIDEIPTIDLSALSTGLEENDLRETDSSPSDVSGHAKLVSEIGHACKNWGFFQVVNHGVPLELGRKIEDVAKKFFELPGEEKRKVKRDMVNALGYHDGEHTKNVRDWKEVFDFLVEDQTAVPASHEPGDEELRVLTNQWPQYPPEFREVCQEYAQAVEKLAYKLLGLIALSLGQPKNRFDDYFKDHQTSLVRLNHYPPCPSPHLALGVGPHKDAGALTVLAQDDVGGLEVRRKSDGEWSRVTPTPDAYIINVGDIVQVWSNDKYESVEHRVVVNSEKERFSIPFFFFPAHHVMVKPLEELLSDGNPAKYREYNWGKFYATRNRSDFKKQEVENIQIHHFKLPE